MSSLTRARRLLILASICACAPRTSETPALTATPPTILTTNRIIEGDRPRSSVTTIAVPPATVWAAAKKVYQALGIEVAIEDPATHRIGNQSFWKIGRLAGRRLSEFVDCGTSMTGRKADSYRIYMSVLTLINPDGLGGTKVETLFLPVGQDVAGGSTDRVPCGSTGELETTINESIRATLGK